MAVSGDNSREEKKPTEARWWETAEDHRFALEVLQLRSRREILKYLAAGPKNLEEIARNLDLTESRAEYHLALLEKALVVERLGESYRLTPTGILYLEKVESRR